MEDSKVLGNAARELAPLDRELPPTAPVPGLLPDKRQRAAPILLNLLVAGGALALANVAPVIISMLITAPRRGHAEVKRQELP